MLISVLSGARGTVGISVNTEQLPASQTGVLAQFTSDLSGVLTFSRISGSGVTINSSGAMTVTTPLEVDESRTVVARVQNTDGDAIEKRFSFVGFSVPVAPVITSPGVISGTRGAGNNLTGTSAVVTGYPTPIVTYDWEVFNGISIEVVGTGLSFVDTSYTAGLPIRRRVIATNASGTVSELSNELAPSAITLAALTIGATTLTDAMGPGSVVATISGKTAGSTISMTGPAFTNNLLAVNGSGTAIVVGVAGPLAAGQATGVFSLVETLSGATNTPRTSGPFSSITSTASAPVGLRLVRLSADYFPDTAVTGDTLATIQFAPVGSTITVQTEDGIANAFTVDGTAIKAGTGYSGIPCRMIVLHIRVTHLGNTKLTRKVVRKHSAGAPSFAVCTTEQNLTDALIAATTALNSAPNTRYVIELNKTGGAEWDALRTIDVNITQPGSQLIIRAPGNPATAPHQKMNRLRLNVRGGEGLYMQNVDTIVRMTGDEWANNVTGTTGSQTSYGGSACLSYTGTSTNTGPYRFLNCNRKGGVVSHAGYNPDLSYDPRNDVTSKGTWRIPELFYFRVNYSASDAPIASVAPYDPVARTTLTAIERANHPSGGLFNFQPQYVGDNLPNGVLPDMTGWPATGGVPLIFHPGDRAGGPTVQASMRMGVVYLAEGHPDAYAGAGNYANAIQIDSWGDGYNLPGSIGNHANFMCYWATRPGHPNEQWTRRNLRSLSTGESNSSGVSPDIEWDQCRFEDLSNVMLLPPVRAGTKRFLHKPLVDRFTLDIMAWGTTSSTSVVQQDWGPTSPKIRIWFPIFGRALSTSADATDPHSDVLQLFSQGSAPDLRFYLDAVGWTYDAGRFTRGSAQCYFFTDSNPQPTDPDGLGLGDSYDGNVFWHCQRGGIKSLQINFTSRWRQHRFLSTSGSYQLALGQDGAPGIRRDELGSYAYVSEQITPAATFPKSSQVLVENYIPYSAADFPAMNTYDFMDTYEKVIESFTPAVGSAVVGHTPVEFLEQECDWIHGGHDPDSVPVKFPFTPNFDVTEGVLSVSVPRQIHYGVDPINVVLAAGTSYQTGGQPDLNGDMDGPSGWITANGTVSRGPYIKLRKTTPTGTMQQGIAEISLNGSISQARSYTKDKATPLIVANAATGSWLISDNATSQSPAASFDQMRRMVFFGKLRVPFPYIPSGNLTLFRGSDPTNPTHVYLTSSGNLRIRSGVSSELTINFDRQKPLKAGGDYTFVCAIDFNVYPYFDDPANATSLTSLRPGVVQAFADFVPMVQNSGGTGFTSGPLDQTAPFKLGSDPTIFRGDGTTSFDPIGWGLYHFGIWADTGTANLPDFFDWNVLRRFTSEFLDGDTAPYPGKGVIEALGPGLRLLVRGDVAAANGAGLPNLAPNSAPNTNAGPLFGAGSMTNFVLGSGAQPFTGIITPTEANFPVINNGFSAAEPLVLTTSSVDRNDWVATALTPINYGERLVVFVSSDGTSNVLSIHPDSLGNWTFEGRASAGDAIIHVFTCINLGAEPINTRLRLTGTVSEHMVSHLHKVTPRYPGATIGFDCEVGTTPSDPPSLDIGSVRKAVWMVARARSTVYTTVSAELPLDYTASRNFSTGTSGGNIGSRLQSGRREFEGQVENPGQWQGTTASDPGGNATVAVWEVLP